MSDKPEFVFVRGPVTLHVDGQEVGNEPAEEPTTGAITRSGTFEVDGGGDYLDFYMMVEPERMDA